MDAVTGWVHPLLKRWAKHLRNPDTGWPPVSLSSRIRQQGPVGAAIRGVHDYIPVKDTPPDVKAVHRVIVSMPNEMRQVIEARYLMGGRDQAKWTLLRMKRHEYYRWLGQAQTWIAARLSNETTSRE